MTASGWVDRILDWALLILDKALTPSTRIHWLYLLTALAMAVFVYVRNRDDYGGTPLRQFLFPRSVWLHRSALTDYAFAALTLPAWYLAVSPLLLYSSDVQSAILSVATAWLSEWHASSETTFTAAATYTIVLLLAADLERYWMHRLFHRIPVFWEFHKVHHSAEVLTPVSFYRVHPLQNLVTSFAAALVIGSVTGIFVFLFPDELSPLTIFGVNAGRFAFNLFGANLRHSHIWLSFGRLAEHVFISPAQHQIHHSNHPRHFDRNFGSQFALWDWMFGSLYLANRRERIVFGLGDEENRRLSTVPRLFFSPFGAVARKLSSQRPQSA
ncbi:MAG TPA: sterol desaturase family protein [Woeseiaceae bacterium]|nr:sterol desaturase family protein [Woeseiaceae bacterium]